MNLLLRSCRRADARLGRYLATQPAPTESFGNPHAHQSRTSVLTKLSHSPGSLHDVLKYFWKNDVNLTHIESRPCPRDSDGFHVVIDFDGHVGDAKTDRLLSDLSSSCADMLILDEREVPWFPRHISELDALAVRCLDAGTDLQADHPGFSDPLYRARRSELARIAEQYRFGEPIPYVEYTAEEVATWGAVYDNLHAQHRKHACAEYLSALPLMERHCGYARDRIPQAQDISDFLMSRTGFQLRPVTGLLSARDFLNGLAFRSFFSTQYIRHASMPLYTPEPDICHELLGHVPMFADPDFADFSQEIGLASLGAADADIERLASCYWFSVEFGLVRARTADAGGDLSLYDTVNFQEGGSAVKAYGAGLLSSFGELQYACRGELFPWRPKGTPSPPSTTSAPTAPTAAPTAAPTGKVVPGLSAGPPRLLPWDPHTASVTPYPICSYQPTYFVAESMADAKLKMRLFCEGLPRPFFARYNPLTSSIWVDRAVRTVQGGKGKEGKEGSPYPA